MKSRIVDKLKYAEKPELEIADGVTVKVNNKAMALLEASEIVDGNINRAAVDRLLELLYSPEDIEKINCLDLNLEDFMTVLQDSISAAIGVEEKNGVSLTLATT